MLKKNIDISNSSDFGDDIGDIEIKIDGDDQQPNRDDQDGDDQDGDNQDGDNQDGDDQDGDNQDGDNQDGDDDTPPPPPPIEEFELQSLTLLLNSGFKFHRVGDRSMLEYQYLLFNTNSYTTFNFLTRIASVRFLPSEDRYYAQSKLDVIEDEMGELTNEIVDQIKEIDKKLLEYIIINFKLNGDYYNEDGFYRYMYDKYRNMLLSVASKSSSEFQINDNPRFVIASANDSGKEFIFNSYSMSLELEGSCKLYINDDEKKVNFVSKTRVEEDVMDLSYIIYQLKNQIFVVGGLNIYDKNSSEITKEFLYYVNLIN
jgi:hypothetical protein